MAGYPLRYPDGYAGSPPQPMANIPPRSPIYNYNPMMGHQPLLPMPHPPQPFYPNHMVPTYGQPPLPYQPVYMNPQLHQHHLPHPSPPPPRPPPIHMHHPLAVQKNFPTVPTATMPTSTMMIRPAAITMVRPAATSMIRPGAAAMVRPTLTTMTVSSTVSTASAVAAIPLPRLPCPTSATASPDADTDIVFRKFAEVVELNGEIQATHEQVLTVFLQLSKKERKLVMAEGSIRSFLSKCPYIDVAGNTLSMVEQPQNLINDSKVEDAVKMIADQVYPCTDSAMELFENRAYMCGISLEKDGGDSAEESGDSTSQDPEVDVKCLQDQTPGDRTTDAVTTQWSVVMEEDDPVVTDLAPPDPPKIVGASLTYSADYENRLSESEDECDSADNKDQVTNRPAQFVDMRTTLRQLKERLFVKSIDPVDTVVKRIVYDAMLGALTEVTTTQPEQPAHYVLRVDSEAFVPKMTTVESPDVVRASSSGTILNACSPEFRPQCRASVEKTSTEDTPKRRSSSYGVSSRGLVGAGDMPNHGGVCSKPSPSQGAAGDTTKHHSVCSEMSPGTVSDKPRHRSICSVPSHDQGSVGDSSKHRGVHGVTSPERGSVGRGVRSVHSPEQTSGGDSPKHRGVRCMPSLRLQRCVSTNHCGIQTEPPSINSVMTNTKSKRTKDCATQTSTSHVARSDVAINTVESLFERNLKYHLVPVVNTASVAVNTPKIHMRSCKSQCTVACEDGTTMTWENIVHPTFQRTTSETDDSCSVKSTGAVALSDFEPSHDIIQADATAAEVSALSSVTSSKEAVFKKPPGLPNIQQLVKKSKKSASAKALKAKSLALKAVVVPEVGSDTGSVSIAAVPPVLPTKPDAMSKPVEPITRMTESEQHLERRADSRHRERSADMQREEGSADVKHRKRSADDRHRERSADDRHRERSADDRHPERCADNGHRERSADDKHRERIADDKHRERNADDRHRERSADDRHRERSADDRHRERSADDRHRERSADDRHRERSADDRHRERSADDRHRERSADDRHRERSADDRHRERSADDRHRERSPDTRHKERRADMSQSVSESSDDSRHGKVMADLQRGEVSTRAQTLDTNAASQPVEINATTQHQGSQAESRHEECSAQSVSPSTDATVEAGADVNNPLLHQMMLTLLKVNPSLSANPRLLQTTAMNHMMALKQRQQLKQQQQQQQQQLQQQEQQLQLQQQQQQQQPKLAADHLAELRQKQQQQMLLLQQQMIQQQQLQQPSTTYDVQQSGLLQRQQQQLQLLMQQQQKMQQQLWLGMQQQRAAELPTSDATSQDRVQETAPVTEPRTQSETVASAIPSESLVSQSATSARKPVPEPVPSADKSVPSSFKRVPSPFIPEPSARKPVPEPVPSASKRVPSPFIPEPSARKPVPEPVPSPSKRVPSPFIPEPSARKPVPELVPSANKSVPSPFKRVPSPFIPEPLACKPEPSANKSVPTPFKRIPSPFIPVNSARAPELLSRKPVLSVREPVAAMRELSASTNVPSQARPQPKTTNNNTETASKAEDWDDEINPYPTPFKMVRYVAPAPAPAVEPSKIPTQPQPSALPGNFFRKPSEPAPTPTLIPVSSLAGRDNGKSRLKLTDKSEFPGLTTLGKSCRQQTRMVAMDAAVPKKTANSGSMSGLSEICLNPYTSSSGLSGIPPSGFGAVADTILGQNSEMDDDFNVSSVAADWQQVVGKKKKGVAEKPMNSFEKLVAKLQEMNPDAPLTVIHDAIKQVRQKHAGLKGVPMSQVISDASKIIGAVGPTDNAEKESGDGTKINLHKSRICQYWLNGTCVQGDKCCYAHGKKDLRALKKTKMCQNMLRGYCQYGDQCIFAHSEDELVKTKVPNDHVMKPCHVLRPMKSAEPAAPPKAPSWTGWSDTSDSQLTLVKDINGMDVECVICVDSIRQEERKMLECGHIFHDKCIRRWLLGVGTRTCPTCRRHALLADDFPKLG